jgi:toxin ParE1/3/4
MARIIWSDDAISDLNEIKKYIARDSPEIANKFVNTIIKKIENLHNLPLMGRIVPEKNNMNLRELLYKKYRIICEIENEIVKILIIIHGTRILKFES